MESDKTKSLVRTASTTITFASLLGATAMGVIDPVTGGLVSGGMGVLLVHLKKWYEDDRESRLNMFHKELFAGLSAEKMEELVETPFTPDDYYAFLKYLLDDEEIGKASIYGKIFRALICNQIEMRFKALMVRSARELKLVDFEMLLEYDAASGDDFKIKHMAVSIDPMRLHSIQNLIHYGYLSDKDGTKPPYPTPLLRSMAVLIKV